MTTLDDFIAELVALQQANKDCAATLARTKEELVTSRLELEATKKALAECQAGDSGGTPPPATDLPGWDLIFRDDFSVDVPLGQFPTAVKDRWGAYPTTYRDTSKNGVYDAARCVSIKDGIMNIHMHTTSDGIHRVACLIPYIKPPAVGSKWPGQLYGRYAIRARFPDLMPGYKVAWLLWPNVGTNTSGSPSGTGGNGEIDFPEHNLSQQARTSGFMHRQDATVGNDQYSCSGAVDLKQWHTFVTEWSKDLCVFKIDDREIGRTTSRVPNTSMRWTIQCETQLSGGEPADNVQGDIEVDWVAIWAKK